MSERFKFYNEGMKADGWSSWIDDDDRLEEAIAAQTRYYDEIEEGFVGITDKVGRLQKWDEFYHKEIPTPPMIISPFFPRGGLALLHGKRGLGKTMFGLEIARCVDKGEPLFGEFPTTKGRVLYLQLDMVEKVFHDRLRASGDYLKLKNAMVFVGAMNILRVSDDDQRIKDARAFEPDLIIMDTLRKSHSLDENDSNTPSKYLGKLRELFGWEPAILLVHHDRKTYEGNSINTDEAFRGSGAWLDDVDAGMQLVKSGNGLKLHFTKVRTCGEIDDISVRVDEDNMVLRKRFSGLIVPEVSSFSGNTNREKWRKMIHAFQKANQDIPAEDLKDACSDWLKTHEVPKSEISKLTKEVF